MNLVLSDFCHMEVFEQFISSQKLDALGSERSEGCGGAERRSVCQMSELKGAPSMKLHLVEEISQKRCVTCHGELTQCSTQCACGF